MTYTPTPGTNIREAIENSIKMARATGKTIIVEMNSARFSVNGDTKTQDAIDAYLEVKRKMFETEKQLKQNKR
jgi:hypothetical protein